MTTLIYSNYNLYDRKEETKQYLFEYYNDIYQVDTSNDIPLDDVYRHIGYQDNDTWDTVYKELNNFINGNTWLIFGTFEGWRGRQAAGKIITSLSELAGAWEHCDYLELTDNNGHFHIKASHHDGTNYYELKRITDKGLELLENGYHDYDTHNTIFNYNLFSGLPHFAREVYGA